jgi:hypothetical protein
MDDGPLTQQPTELEVEELPEMEWHGIGAYMGQSCTQRAEGGRRECGGSMEGHRPGVAVPNRVPQRESHLGKRELCMTLKCSLEMVQEWQDDITKAKTTFGPGSDEHCKAVAWAEAQGPALVADYLTLTAQLHQEKDWTIWVQSQTDGSWRVVISYPTLREAQEFLAIQSAKDFGRKLPDGSFLYLGHHGIYYYVGQTSP